MGFRFLKRTIFVLLLWICVAALPVAAETVREQASRLLEAVERDGDVRVIVTMGGAHLSAALQSGDLDDSQLRAAVRVAREAMLSGLASSDYLVSRQFDYVPQVALRVNHRALKVLLFNSNLQVVESRPRRISLAQSVPRIYGNHATSPYTGNGWTVAVLDTGVDRDHAFLGGRLVNEACYSTTDGVDETTSLCPNGSTVQIGTGAAAPCSGIDFCEHGTHIAGVAAGDGAAFDGVAREANLIAIQVFSRSDSSSLCAPDPTPCVVAYPDDIIAGLDRVYALRNSYNIAAVNLSLGQERAKSDCSTEPEEPFISKLKNVGIATVIASGNDAREFVNAPACVEAAIAVGSTPDNADTRSSYSNNGVALDFYAPGETVTSSVPGGGFDDKASTSVAAAHVSGTWAVLKQLKPTATVSQLEDSMKDVGPLVTDNAISRHRIDIDGALCALDISLASCTVGNIVPLLDLLLL